MQKFLLQLPYSFSARYSDLFIRKIYFAMIFVLFFSFFALPIFALEDSGWKISYKEQAGWNTTDFDDSKWSSVKVPYSNYTNIKSAWFRRTIDMRENEIVSASLKLTALEIGSDVWSYGTPADKYYGYPPTTCWVNGRQVNSLSENTAPVAFMPGRNSIACRADSYNYVYTTKCWVGYYRPDCNSVENWLRFDFDVNVSLTYYQPDSLYFLCNEKIGCQIGGPKFDSMCEASCFPWGRKIDPSRYCSSNTINRCLFAWDNPVIRKYFIFNLIEPPKYMTPKNPNSKTPSNPLQYSQFKYISVHSTEPVKCFVDGSPLKLKQYGEPYWNLWAGLYAKPNELHIVECEIEHKSGDGNSVQKWSGPFFEWVWEPNYHEFDLEITDTAPIDISASTDGEAGAPLDIDVLLSSAGFHKAKLYSELWTNLTNGTAIRVDAAKMDVNFTNKISENFILQPLLWRDHKNYTLIVSAVDSLNRTFQKHFPVVLKENQLPELENFSINGSSCKLKRESCNTSCAAYETDSWQCPTGKIICNHVNNWGNGGTVYKAPKCKIEYPSQFQYEYPAYPEYLYPDEGEIKKAKDAGCAPELVRGGSSWFCDGWFVEWKTCSEPRCISKNITCSYSVECDNAGDLNIIVSNIAHAGNEDTIVYVIDTENKLITSLPEGDHNLKIEVKDKIDNDNAFFNILLSIVGAEVSQGVVSPFILMGGGEKNTNQGLPHNSTPIMAGALALAGIGSAGYFIIRRNSLGNLKQKHSTGIGDQHTLMATRLAEQKSRAAKIAFDIQEEDRRRGWEEAQAWNAAKKFQEREQEKILEKQKKLEGLQYALANTDRMHTYEQKAKELEKIQNNYSDVLTTEGKAALASQVSWFTKESERLYASYNEAKAQQTLTSQQTINLQNTPKKIEQTPSAKQPMPASEMKLPIKINKINYGNANEKIDNWLVSNSESVKKVGDGLGWASLGIFIAGAVLTLTGFGAVAGVPLMAAAFGSGAISGGLDFAVGSARQKAGIANEDDYWRMGFAPLAFIPGLGGAKQALKQIGKQAGKILGGLIKPLAELVGNSGKIGVVVDKAKNIFMAGKKIATETIAAVKNTARDFESKVKNVFSNGKEKFVEPTAHMRQEASKRSISDKRISDAVKYGKPYYDDKTNHVVRIYDKIAVVVGKAPNNFTSKGAKNDILEKIITVHKISEKQIENRVANGRWKSIGGKVDKNSYYDILQKIYGNAPEITTAVKNIARDFGSKVKNILFNAAEPIRKSLTRLENKVIDGFSKSIQARFGERSELVIVRNGAENSETAVKKIITNIYDIDGKNALKVLKEKDFSGNDMKTLSELAEAERNDVVKNGGSIINKILKQKNVANEAGSTGNIRGALTEAKAALHYSGPNKKVFMNVLMKNDGTPIILKGNKKTSRIVGQQVDLLVIENGEAMMKNGKIIVRGGNVKLVEVKTNVGLNSEHFLPYNIERSQLEKYKQVAKAFEKKTGIATKVELYSKGIYNKNSPPANENIHSIFKSIKSWLEGIFFRMREEMMA